MTTNRDELLARMMDVAMEAAGPDRMAICRDDWSRAIAAVLDALPRHTGSASMSANTSDVNVSITPDLLELSGDFGFRPTGVIEVDMLLASIVAAGKAYGHTKSWLTSSAAQWIQMRADSCADAFRGKSAKGCSAESTKAVLDTLDSIASTFQDSDIKDAIVLIRAQSAELASLRARCDAAEREVEVLRQYGNKECTAMADEALTTERAKEGETRK